MVRLGIVVAIVTAGMTALSLSMLAPDGESPICATQLQDRQTGPASSVSLAQGAPDRSNPATHMAEVASTAPAVTVPDSYAWLVEAITRAPHYDLPANMVTMTGIVQEPDGRPVPGARIEATPAGDYRPTFDFPGPDGDLIEAIAWERWQRSNRLATTTATDGTFTLRGLSGAMSYRLAATHPDYACERGLGQRTVDPTVEPHAVMVLQPLATVSFRAVLPDGTSPHEVTSVENTIGELLTEHAPDRIIGDKTYESDCLDERLRRERGIEMNAPNRNNKRVKC